MSFNKAFSTTSLFDDIISSKPTINIQSTLPSFSPYTHHIQDHATAIDFSKSHVSELRGHILL